MRCGWVLLLVVVLGASLSLAVPVRGDAPADHEAGNGRIRSSVEQLSTEKPAEEGGGVFAGVLDLSLWTLVVFLVLVAVLTKYAWKPMIQGLDARERAIHEALAEAEKARTEAHFLRTELQAEMDRAADKVRALLEEAHRNAERTAHEIVAKAHAQNQADRERLQREMEIARDQALQEIWGQAAQLATLVSRKAIRRQLNPDDHRQLVDEALAELRTVGNNQPAVA
jgi:F-type H+-transporting ATPase subunit b